MQILTVYLFLILICCFYLEIALSPLETALDTSYSPIVPPKFSKNPENGCKQFSL